jgi:hypothetical protein
MRSPLLRPCLVCSLLSCAVIAGCHQVDRACPTCGGQHVAAVPAPVAVAVAPVSPYSPVVTGPITHEVLKTTTAPAAVVDHTDWQSSSGRIHEKLQDRRTFTDLTANPAFAHAPDYSWLVGELRAMGPGVWSVRFASVDEDRDTVILVDAPPMIDIRAGQLVRVEGQLVDPASHEAGASYRVTAIHPADRDSP